MGMNNDRAPWYRFSSRFYKGFESRMVRAYEPKNWMKVLWLYKRFCAEVAEVNFSTGIIPSLGKTTRKLRLDVLERYFGMEAELIEKSIRLLFDVNLIEIQGENYVIKGWTDYQYIKAFKTAQKIRKIREEKKWDYKLEREMNRVYGKPATQGNTGSKNVLAETLSESEIVESKKENVFVKKVGGRPESLEVFVSEMASIMVTKEKAIAIYQQHEATMINGEWVDAQNRVISNRIKYFEKAAEQWYEPQGQNQSQNKNCYQSSNQQQSNQENSQQMNQNQQQNNLPQGVYKAGGMTFNLNKNGNYVYPRGKAPANQSIEIYNKVNRCPGFKAGFYPGKKEA